MSDPHGQVKLTIAWIGKTKSPAIQSLSDEYIKRLKQFASAEGVSVKDETAILKISGHDGRGARRTLALFDSRGKQFSSEEFAQFVGQRQDTGAPMMFGIGAANGFSQSALKQADFVISLGKMTLAHELARVVALEQLYRAFTILKGHPYHLGH